MTSYDEGPVVCHDCGRHMNIDHELVYEKVTGYIHRRDAGGANQVSLKTYLQEWLCPKCFNDRNKGIAGQTGLDI